MTTSTVTSRLSVSLLVFTIIFSPMFGSLRFCGNCARRLRLFVEARCRWLLTKRNCSLCSWRFLAHKAVLKLGCSSLAIALVLPDSGCLVACERDANGLEVARRYYDKAGVSHKVKVKHLKAKSDVFNGEASCYDFAFVDAEKRMNQEYFELLLQLVRVGGVIVIDNVLWHGKVADPLVNDVRTVSIRNFNKTLMEDSRFSISTYRRWYYNLPQKIMLQTWFISPLFKTQKHNTRAVENPLSSQFLREYSLDSSLKRTIEAASLNIDY